MLQLVGKLYKTVFVDEQNALDAQMKAGSRDKIAPFPPECLQTAFMSAFCLNVCKWLIELSRNFEVQHS